MDRLAAALEAILFASERPVPMARLREALGDAPEAEVHRALEEIRRGAEGHGFELVEVAGAYQLATRPEHAEAVAGFRKARAERRLTPSAQDTLAIVAYRQPITRAEVEALRGAQSGEILRALLDAGLVKIAGRAKTPGAPLLYATTPRFLETFGLRSLADLPKPQEVR